MFNKKNNYLIKLNENFLNDNREKVKAFRMNSKWSKNKHLSIATDLKLKEVMKTKQFLRKIKIQKEAVIER